MLGELPSRPTLLNTGLLRPPLLHGFSSQVGRSVCVHLQSSIPRAHPSSGEGQSLRPMRRVRWGASQLKQDNLSMGWEPAASRYRLSTCAQESSNSRRLEDRISSLDRTQRRCRPLSRFSLRGPALELCCCADPNTEAAGFFERRRSFRWYRASRHFHR